MEIIKLNLIPSGVNPVCHCSQYDTERVIRAELFDGLTPYSLTSGDEITLNVRKPDNTVVTADVSVTEGNNYVDLTTTEQICACAGENLCDLTLTNGNKKIGTLNFIMIIERDVLTDGIESQSVIKDLDERVQEAVGDNYYTKVETDAALALKADKSTTFTKTEVNNLINTLNGFLDKTLTVNQVNYSEDGYISTDGAISTSAQYKHTDFIECYNNSVIVLKGVFSGSSSLAYAFYDKSKAFISGGNNISGDLLVTTIPINAQYVRLGTQINDTYKGYIFNDKYFNSELKKINDKIINPINTSFFVGVNYFEPTKADLYEDRFINTTGQVRPSTGTNTLVIPVKPNTEYFLHIPSNNRGIIVENNTPDFELMSNYTLLYSSGTANIYHFTTGSNGNYIAVYFYSGTYDYETNKAHIVLNIGQYYGENNPYIPSDYLPQDIANVLNSANILIFGDSITDCCNLTINQDNETTAYSWRNPSNSYVNGQGVTIQYSMWAKILKESQPCQEIRNYALSGASYKTSERSSGNERQNLQYQIDVALNDVDNPNNVFVVDNFIPDIVIFALGTNDGAPNDTFDSAMSKTVFQSDNISIDVAATLAALDDTKFCESARKAFMRIKQAFPLAQIYCVLPIQRANNDINGGNLHTYLSQMAERYGCIIVDGYSNSGITRDFNNWNALGVYLKDGLHPNDKGQNILARLIISALKSHFIPFGNGFNQV